MNYPTPQYPGYPQQGYPAQPPAQQFPPQYAAPQGYPQQQFPQAPAQQPSQPLAQGTLDDFYNQPTTGSGPSISWKDKPIGTSYMGVVARDVTNGDVQQQVNFQSKQPEFYRDGRPKFVLKVPLKQIVSIDTNTGQAFGAQEFPEGEGTYFVRGQARDELARAMAEAGAEGAPKAGDVVHVTLVQRKPSGQGMNPANVVQIRYQPAAGAGASSPAPAPLPEQAAPAPQPQPAQAPVQQYQQYQQPVPQQSAPAPVAQPAAPQAPQGVAQQGGQMQVPPDFNPEQAALLARITGQPAPGQPAA